MSGDESILVANDVNNKKEYRMFVKHESKGITETKTGLTSEGMGGQVLNLYSYQMLLSTFLNPNNNVRTGLIKWETGMGKSLGMVAISLNFIPYIKTFEKPTSSGSVFIVGFTKSIIEDELIRYPELGFVTDAELKDLKQLKTAIRKGHQSEVKQYSDLLRIVKKRIRNRKKNGIFELMGYKLSLIHI